MRAAAAAAQAAVPPAKPAFDEDRRASRELARAESYVFRSPVSPAKYQILTDTPLHVMAAEAATSMEGVCALITETQLLAEPAGLAVVQLIWQAAGIARALANELELDKMDAERAKGQA